VQPALIGRDAVVRRLSSALGGAPGQCIAIVGEAGVGKTRLAEEIAGVARDQGRSVERVIASPAAATIPFGALAHLLDVPTGSTEPTALMARLIGGLRDRGSAAGSLVLTVDDAHHLDAHSAALIEQVVAHSAASVVLTTRTGETSPPAVAALWSGGTVVQIEIGPLSREATAALAEATLGGPPDPQLEADLWRRSKGNPLFVRELVLAGREAGVLAEVDGAWRATGPLAPSNRLSDLVRSRVGRLSGPEQAVADALAVGGSLELHCLESLGQGHTLEALEQRRIVLIDRNGNRHLVRFTHPLYSDVLVADLPRTRARRVMRQLADWLESTGGRRRADVIRLALWRLDGGGAVDASLLVTAANRALAMFDEPLAERFARACQGPPGGLEARLLLGRALAGQQRIEEAEEVLGRAATEATTDDEIARVALARANLLYFRAGRIGEATQILTDAHGRIDNRDWRSEIDALLTLFRAAAGELPAVAAAGRRMLEQTGARPRAVVHTLVFSSVANVMLGRFEEAEAHIRAGLRLVPAVRDELPLAGQLLQINRLLATAYAGRHDDAVAMGSAAHRSTPEAGAEVAALWALNLGESRQLAGDIDGALQSMLSALTVLRERDPFAVHGIAASIAAVCAAWLGRADQARALHREVVDLRLARDVRSRIQHDRADVWVTWLDAGPSVAAERALAAGRQAVADTHLVWGAFLLHDAVRLGSAAGAAAGLTELSGRIEGDLVPAMALHAQALAGDDPVSLERAASAFERLGSRLCAAEAAAHAHQAYLRRGRVRLARVVAARAVFLASRCADARTPAIIDMAPVALTDRELDVVRLAATGLPSRDVATRLGISVRTVDNHLGAVYSKLGVAGRSELAGVLGLEAVTDGPSPGT
jgi:ATP/maltotriose-dependent transcriptional regulator MalT